MTAQEFNDQFFALTERQREMALYAFLGGVAYLSTDAREEPTKKELLACAADCIQRAKKNYP